jgi:ABC-type glycerol-3-phosphate transport system permease component
MMMRSTIRIAGIAISSCLVLTICLFPFFWMALSSIKPLGELYALPLHWLPTTPTLEHYRDVLLSSNVPRYFLNSAVISAGSTRVSIALAAFAAYGFARIQFRGKGAALGFVLTAQLLPTAAIIVPLFITLRTLGLVNTYLGLILVYTILTLPLAVWLLTSYFRSIPVELEEAALMDGLSRLGILFRITLPLSLPGIAAVVVNSFVTTWNEFIFALVFAQDSRVRTLPIGIAEFTTEFNTDWGAVMAASVLMTLPVAVLFAALQRLFIGGLTAGAVKG